MNTSYRGIYEFEYTAPEDLHMRPCWEIVRFVQSMQKEHTWVSVFLLREGKSAEATSILGLFLLNVKKWDIFSIQIDGWNWEQINLIQAGFSQLVERTLSNPQLHERKGDLWVPSWITVPRSNEKHPEHAKFDERYMFLLRAKKLLEENVIFFQHPKDLSKKEADKKREFFLKLSLEEDKMVKRHSMSLLYGWCIIWYLCWDTISDGSKWEEFGRVIGLVLPKSIIEAQSHLGILPVEIKKPIYDNLEVLMRLRDRIDTAKNAEELKLYCDICLGLMMPLDEWGIHMAAWHVIIGNYRLYVNLLKKDWFSEASALGVYKTALLENIWRIIKQVQEFLYPTFLRTYSKGEVNSI